MAAEMVTDRWEGVRNKASVVPDATWKAVAEAINALDGSVRTLVSIVYKHPSLISIGGGGSNGLYVVQATDDGERFKVATPEAEQSTQVKSRPTKEPISRCAHCSSRPGVDLRIDGWQGVEVNTGFSEGFSVKEATAHFQPEGAG